MTLWSSSEVVVSSLRLVSGLVFCLVPSSCCLVFCLVPSSCCLGCYRACDQVRVTDEPGLGVTLNRDVLERLKARRRDPKHDALYLIKSTYENGTVYAAAPIDPPTPVHSCQTI